MLGWALVWLAGTTAIAGFSMTRHAPALERAMLDGVQDALAPLGDAPVLVSVRDHEATLSGTVDDVARRDALLAAAESGLGVRRVVDRLEVNAADEPAARERSPSASPPLDAATPVEPLADAPSPEELPAGELPPDNLVPMALTSDTVPAATRASAELASEEPPSEGVGLSASTLEALASETLDTPSIRPPGEMPLADESSLVAPRPAALATSSSADALGTVSPTLRLKIADRVLTIEGSLSDGDDATALVGAAMDSFELDFVTTSLEDGANVASADWLGPLAALLPALAGLEDPGIDVAERRITLRGTAPDEATREAVLDAALERLGDYSLVEHIDLGTDTADTADDVSVKDVVPENIAEGSAESSLEDSVSGPVGTLPEVARLAPVEPRPAGAPGDDMAALRTALATLPSDEILFESGSDTLTARSLGTLDEIASVLRRHPRGPVTIEGHTDGIGLREVNLRLSQKRANAVRDHLLARGVSRDRLTAYGYGEGVPVADNATPQGRAANRRIEFTY